MTKYTITQKQSVFLLKFERKINSTVLSKKYTITQRPIQYLGNEMKKRRWKSKGKKQQNYKIRAKGIHTFIHSTTPPLSFLIYILNFSQS